MGSKRLTPHQKKLNSYKKDTRPAKVTEDSDSDVADSVSKHESHKKMRSELKRMVRKSPKDSSITAAAMEAIHQPKPRHQKQVRLGEALKSKHEEE